MATQTDILHCNFFKDDEGHPLLKIFGRKLTTSAYQQLTTSFREVLEAVVKNPHSTLMEITTNIEQPN